MTGFPSRFHPAITASAIVWVALAVSLAKAQGFVPLFNGTTLGGWHIQGPGRWQVVNGVIEGNNDTGSSQWGHLVTDSVFTNFVLRFQWKLSPGGNSGCYFHAGEGGTAGMIGPQIEMDGVNNGVYTTATNPWGWVAPAVAVGSSYKPNDWNQMEVTLQGNRVTALLNGMQVVNVTSAAFPANGRFGFQVHPGVAMAVSLKNIEISQPAVGVIPAKGVHPQGGSLSAVYDLKGRRLEISGVKIRVFQDASAAKVVAD